MPETITTTIIGVRRRRRSVSYTYPDDGRDYGDSYYTEYDHDGNETGRQARRDSLGHPGRAPSPPPRPSTAGPSFSQSSTLWDEPADAPRLITAGSSHHHHQSASHHGSHAQSDHATVRPPHSSSHYAGSRAPSHHGHHHTSSRHSSHGASGSHHSHSHHSHHSSRHSHGHGHGGGSRHHETSHRHEDPIPEETESVTSDQLYINKKYPTLPIRPKSIHYSRPHSETHNRDRDYDRDHDRHGHRSSHHSVH